MFHVVGQLVYPFKKVTVTTAVASTRAVYSLEINTKQLTATTVRRTVCTKKV